MLLFFIFYIDNISKVLVVLEIDVFSQYHDIKNHLFNWLTVTRNGKLLEIYDSLAFSYNGKPLPENEMVGNLGYGSEKIIVYIKRAVSEAHAPLNNLYILLRNVEECKKSASMGGNPR